MTDTMIRGLGLLRSLIKISAAIVLLVAFAAGFWMVTATKTTSKTILGEQKSVSGESSSNQHTLPARFVDELGIVEDKFEVRNYTDRAVHILDLKTSCTCAGADIADQHLNPGEQTRLVMKVDQRGRTKTFSAECLIVHDAGEPARFTIISPIYRRIEFNPPAVQLGVVQPASGIEREVLLVTRSRDTVDFRTNRSLSVASTMDRKTIGVAELQEDQSKVEELAGGVFSKQTPVKIRLTLPGTAGPGSCEIVPDDKESTKQAETRLRINWFVESPYIMTPNRIFFESNKEVNIDSQYRVKIHRRDGTAFRIEDVRCGSKEVILSCATKGKSQETHEIVVTVNTSGASGFLYDQIMVLIDDPVIRQLSIPIAGSR